MTNTRIMIAAAAAVAVLASAPALAGPCGDDIASLGRTLAQSASLGPVTTGTLTGSGPASTATAAAKPDAMGTSGTSAGQKLGGTAGTKELNAATGNTVATSSQDVRAQQEGKPTAAATAAKGSGKSVETTPQGGRSDQANDRMSMAKTELEHARKLDQANDTACSASIGKVKELVKG